MPRVTPLKLAIVASGVPAREIAAQIGCSGSVLSKWARGHRVPSATAAVALAEALDTTVEDLFPPADESQAA